MIIYAQPQYKRSCTLTVLEEQSDARQRVLDVAEELFMARGYSAITLRDIADALHMKQASLYYHFPEGNEQLFIAVATRTFARHQVGMQGAIDQAGPNLRSQLQALAAWFNAQPPINLMGMMHADMPALHPAQREKLGQVAYDSMFTPLRSMFTAAQQRGEIRLVQPDLLAGFFLTLLDSLNHAVGRPGAPTRAAMTAEIVTLLLDGLLRREHAPANSVVHTN